MQRTFMHLFFNMFALWMFGRILESVWGPKRFFIYYFVTGLGAAALHLFVNFLEYQSLISKMSPEQVDMVMREGMSVFRQGKNFSDPLMGQLNLLMNIPTVGASGAVYGVLLGFGVLFPNTQLLLLFPTHPHQSQIFCHGYGLLELYLGFARPGSNVAHFAHWEGMLFWVFAHPVLE
jgi:membrane associated rhomboid family serine protease